MAGKTEGYGTALAKAFGLMPEQRRPRALVNKATYKSQRSYEDLIRDVYQIGESKPHIKTKKGIRRELLEKPQYQKRGDRTVRRDMDFVFPPAVWRRYKDGWLAFQRLLKQEKIRLELLREIRDALAAPDRPGIRVIAKQFGVSPVIVRTIEKVANNN
jgi:hypothetical protein